MKHFLGSLNPYKLTMHTGDRARTISLLREDGFQRLDYTVSLMRDGEGDAAMLALFVSFNAQIPEELVGFLKTPQEQEIGMFMYRDTKVYPTLPVENALFKLAGYFVDDDVMQWGRAAKLLEIMANREWHDCSARYEKWMLESEDKVESVVGETLEVGE